LDGGSKKGFEFGGEKAMERKESQGLVKFVGLLHESNSGRIINRSDQPHETFYTDLSRFSGHSKRNRNHHLHGLSTSSLYIHLGQHDISDSICPETQHIDVGWS
jgi:hypothetical protein